MPKRAVFSAATPSHLNIDPELLNIDPELLKIDAVLRNIDPASASDTITGDDWMRNC